METLKVGQKLFFEMLSRVDASRREPTVPVCCSVLKRDDEKFGEVASSPLAEAMAASYHMRNLWRLVFL
jgi:hypothetical protein